MKGKLTGQVVPACNSILQKKPLSACGKNLPVILPPLLCIFLIILSLLTGLSIQADAARKGLHWQDEKNSEWKYFKSSKELSRKWHHADYDDSGWSKGKAGFGYGGGKHSTPLNDMRGKYKRIYSRRAFHITSPSAIKKMYLSVVCDGPFIAYLNGIEVLRNKVGMPDIDDGSGRLRPLRIEITGFAHEMFPGRNVISIQCDNDDSKSGDFEFIPFFEVIER